MPCWIVVKCEMILVSKEHDILCGLCTLANGTRSLSKMFDCFLNDDYSLAPVGCWASKLDCKDG